MGWQISECLSFAFHPLAMEGPYFPRNIFSCICAALKQSCLYEHRFKCYRNSVYSAVITGKTVSNFFSLTNWFRIFCLSIHCKCRFNDIEKIKLSQIISESIFCGDIYDQQEYNIHYIILVAKVTQFFSLNKINATSKVMQYLALSLLFDKIFLYCFTQEVHSKTICCW